MHSGKLIKEPIYESKEKIIKHIVLITTVINKVKIIYYTKALQFVNENFYTKHTFFCLYIIDIFKTYFLNERYYLIVKNILYNEYGHDICNKCENKKNKQYQLQKNNFIYLVIVHKFYEISSITLLFIDEKPYKNLISRMEHIIHFFCS